MGNENSRGLKPPFGLAMSGEDNTVLCDFDKFYGAVLTKDEEFAKEWYKKEYLKSCFANSPKEGLRALKSGFIVLVGYMRSAVLRVSRNSAAILIESAYMHAVENCMDEESIFRLFVSAFREFCGTASVEAIGDSEFSICIDYILTNLKSTLSLTEIAVHCGYNPSYLSRKFKQIYGISIKRYILGERLKAAATLLSFTGLSIAEISSMFKFSSQSHFQKEFKKVYGSTPLRYRLEANKKL